MEFFKKPKTVDAVQYDGDNEDEIYSVFGSAPFMLLGDSTSFMLSFENAHGDTAYARPGDWIVFDPDHKSFEAVKDSVMKTDYYTTAEGETN